MSKVPVTYCCPFLLSPGPRLSHGVKRDNVIVSCECGTVKLPVSAWMEYRDRYCCDVNGWRDCTPAKVLLKWYEDGET